MDSETLKKVQSVFLEITLEVTRVCEENNIPYSLCCGTFLGAVRHQGFIPWDDDVDLCMLREDYERFRRIAPQKLDSRYCFQDWHTEENYPHPFGKVRKKGTHYVESKGCPLKEDGFYVDIFPVDNAPQDLKARKALARRQLHLYRLKLMKSGCTVWKEEDRTILKKRLGYIPYQIAACFFSQKKLNALFDRTIEVPAGDTVYEQTATPVIYYFPDALCRSRKTYDFCGHALSGYTDADTYLRILYGDYMQLPPEDQRENRHQIRVLDFGRDA